MAKVIYRLSRIRSGDKAEVLVRFYAGSVDLYAKSRIYVPVKRWNDKEHRLSYSTRYYTPEVAELSDIQKRLDALSSSILDSYTKTINLSKEWLQETIDAFVSPGTSQSRRITAAEACDLYVTHKSSITSGTANHYRQLARLLSDFSSSVRPLYVGSINVLDIDDFAAFIESDFIMLKSGTKKHINRGQNTISMKLKKLRSLLRWCRQFGLSDNCPFDNYSIREEFYGRPIFLSIEERDTVLAASMPSAVLELVRDVFVFQCFVGCRVGDLYELTNDNITGDGLFIVYKQEKVSDVEAISVPLLDQARMLIAKYAGKDKHGRLFPFVAEQTYNEYIKRVLEIAGIFREVIVYDHISLSPMMVPLCQTGTSHLARRTFIGNLKKKKKSERITSAFTGHKNGSKALKRYTDVDDDMKLEIIQCLNSEKMKS